MGLVLENDNLEIHGWQTSGGGGKFGFHYQDGNGGSNGQISITAANTYTAGKWHRVACTWNRSGNAEVVMDGVSQGTADMTSKTWTSKTATVKQFGKTGDGTAGRWFDGVLAYVQVFNIQLTIAQIEQALWFPGTVCKGNLMMFWPLWGRQSPEIDYSSNGRNGTVEGCILEDGPPSSRPLLLIETD